MPELPEVETVVKTLRPELVGRKITKVWKSRMKLRRPWKKVWERQLRNAQIQTVARRGKWIIIGLDNDSTIIVHLGMTGRLRVLEADAPIENHVHVRLWLDAVGGSDLRFQDARRFGSVDLVPSNEVDLFFKEHQLGPEPTEITADGLWKSLNGTERNLKAALMDQNVIAGLGNIYADEALFEAKLHPNRTGDKLTRPQSNRLHKAIKAVVKRAIEKNGSSIRDYLDGNGQPGEYQKEFRVYQQTGRPCPRCEKPIEQIRLAGRSTHYCGSCQK